MGMKPLKYRKVASVSVARRQYAKITINIRRDQAERLQLEGLNVSGFMRELLDYYFQNLSKLGSFQVIGGEPKVGAGVGHG